MNITGAYLGYALLFSELGLAIWRRSARTAGSRTMDANSLRVLWLVIAAATTAGVWLAMRGLGPRLPAGPAWETFGVAVFAAGTILRWWSIRYLGRFFTVDVAVAADHRVVDTGPYRLVRHPSYSGLLLQFTGWALTLGSVPSLVVILLPILLVLLYRIQVEEAALRRSLGEAYVAYMQRTRRLIPGVF